MPNHQHQFMEMKSSKSKGNMMQKDVMCADCGEMRRLHENGKMEVMKKGKEMGNMKDMDEKEMEE